MGLRSFSQRKIRLTANIALLLTSMIWGSAFVFQRIAGEQGLVYLFNGARFFLGALVLLPFAIPVLRKARSGGIASRQWAWIGIAGTVLFIASALQQTGLQYTTAGNASFITSLYVVIVPFLLFAGWGERPHKVALAAVLLAAGGGYLISTGGGFRIQKGDALELLGAVFWALYVVVLGKNAFQYDAVVFSMGHFAVSAVLNLTAGLFLEHPTLSDPRAALCAVVYTGVVSVGIGYTLQFWGQKHTPPTDAALILSLEAVFGALFGFILLGETLTFAQGVGCFLIMSGVLLAQFYGGKPV